MKRTVNRAHPMKGFAPDGVQDFVSWYDDLQRLHTKPATPGLRSEPLESALPARVPSKFPGQSNYHGRYYFAGQVSKLVWHESMAEYTALMWLDHTEHVVAISSQPMCLWFGDGGNSRSHYPDYFLLLADGRRRMLDVRPEERVDDAARLTFERTRVLCERVGWEYDVFTGLDRAREFNLEWLSAFRHERYQPEPAEKAELLGFLAAPRSFDDASRVLDAELPARRIHVLYHLMWTRAVVFEMSVPLQLTTLIERSDECSN